MAHHAYSYGGDREEGIQAARAFAERELGLSGEAHPDVLVYRYGLFSVEDARKIAYVADLAPVAGERKLIALSAERLFHETQNALLKLFEEPPPGTTLVLIVPSLGLLQATLRSRLIPLPHESGHTALSATTRAWLVASTEEREKIVEKLLDRTRSDKDEEKQEARAEALHLVEGLYQVAGTAFKQTAKAELEAFLRDIERFLPILHERSAPYKLIFEHLLLTMPTLPKG